MTADADSELAVVDASAVVALVTSRSATASALADRMRGVVMHAPAILPVEIDSALRGLERGGKLTTEQAEAARHNARALPVDLWPWMLLADRAWQLRHNVSTFDAGYIALAERLGAPLLTGDARLARAPGVRCRIDVFR